MAGKERQDTVPGAEKYEEYKLLPTVWGWVLVLGFSAALIVWAMWLHALIPERPRQWDFGATPDTPAESIYSTVVVPEGTPAVKQIETLPEAEPLKAPARAKTEGK